MIERIIGRVLLDRVASRSERRALAQWRERQQRDMQAADYFQFAAVRMAEEILDQLPEAVPERYAPTQLLLALRAAQGAGLLAIYRDFQTRAPKLTAALVYAGDRAWARVCILLARFLEVQSVA